MPNTPLLARDLRSALAEKRVEVFYQPIFDLATWSPTAIPVGVEALSRWRHRAVGEVPPSRFIQIAHDRGFLDEVDTHVVTTAGWQVGAWQAAGHELGLSINAAAIHFLERADAPDYVEIVLTQLRALRIPPHLLTIEIIESPAPQFIGEMAEGLARLREAGIAISVDDFGAGDTTLEMLERLDVEEVKIDRSLIIRDDAEADETISAVVEVAHRRGMRVVAEGIETPGHLDKARRCGCDRGQGFLLGRPMPAEGIDRMLAGLPLRDYSAG